MLNQIILVGRLVETPKVIETESGKKMSYITLDIPRSFKNADGKYDTDFFDCVLWEVVAESTSEYCKQGYIVGVKGRVQSHMLEDEDGNNYKKMKVVAEKITFLSSKKGKNRMKFVYSDGGRSKYNDVIKVEDCVTRTICNTTGKDYKEVYDLINSYASRERGTNKSTARNGVSKNTTHRVLTDMDGPGCHLCL